MTVRRRTPAVVVAVLLPALLVGCGSQGAATSPAADRSTSASGTPSPAPTDGALLVRSATDALDLVETFHVSGTILSADSGVALSFDITYGRGEVSTGTLGFDDGVSVELRRVVDGTAYAKGSEAFYAQASTPSDVDLTSIFDKWVVVDDAAPLALQFAANLLTKDEFLRSLEPDSGADSTYEVSGPRDVAGTLAYVVTDAKGGTFAVAAVGPPLPVQVKDIDSSSSDASFDGYGDAVTVEPPPAAEIVPVPS